MKASDPEWPRVYKGAHDFYIVKNNRTMKKTKSSNISRTNVHSVANKLKILKWKLIEKNYFTPTLSGGTWESILVWYILQPANLKKSAIVKRSSKIFEDSFLKNGILEFWFEELIVPVLT